MGFGGLRESAKEHVVPRIKTSQGIKSNKKVLSAGWGYAILFASHCNRLVSTFH